ncbi:MAG TPA: ATP-binding protein [Coriobacteriia bacterium]
MATDRITLTVPAKSEYAKTVRMTAAALVSRLGMNYDGVEDVRIAAEEAFVYAVDTLPEDGEVRFEFSVCDDEITIEVALGSENPSSDEEADRRAAYATFILESVCDSYGFETDENGAHLRLVKRVGDGDVD